VIGGVAEGDVYCFIVGCHGEEDYGRVCEGHACMEGAKS